jgi:hypothetical protein
MNVIKVTPIYQKNYEKNLIIYIVLIINYLKILFFILNNQFLI